MAYPYPPQPSAFATVPPQPPAVPTAIIGPQYCATYPVDLAIVKKVMTISDEKLVVTDVNGNIMFKVKDAVLNLSDLRGYRRVNRRVLLDAAGNPLVTLRRKGVNLEIRSAYDRWEAFRGESTDQKDLIFTLKHSSLIQYKTKFDVFLANNTKEDVCDYKVKGSWFERSCVIYAGESDNIVAQMHKKHTVQSILIGKDHFNVTVYPNIDYAFIVALVVILDEINKDSDEAAD